MRVAVVGGGIAGMGAAWALHRAGMQPTVFEKNPELGGNAKTFVWRDGADDVRTGLSVLAWPPAYFHNYGRLLEALEVRTEPSTQLRFFVKSGDDVWAHGMQTPARERYAGDLARWAKLVSRVRSTNAFFAGRFRGEPGSLYDMSPANPMHFLPLRMLWRASGISSAFWENVFVPIHSSSFLSVDLDDLPASIAPILDDIVSLADGGDLLTWSASSRDVFARMTRGFEDRVFTKCGRLMIERRDREVVIEREGTTSSESFDAVVFGCNAHAALAMVGGGTRLERMILGGIRYADELDAMFAHGQIHSDPRVLPDAFRERILEGFANFVERVEDGGKARYENTFVLSSWVPAARGSKLPMLVSYNRRARVDEAVGEVDNERAHPALSRDNLARAFALRAIQGKRRTYFCSSFTTPGNGHDLSLLSGFVVANALGAPYPFGHDRAAREDFGRLRRFMLGRRRT